MNSRLLFRILLISIVTSASLAFACGPYFPSGYVWRHVEGGWIEHPRLTFEKAINDFVDFTPRKNKPEQKKARPVSPWQTTLTADRADLTAAMTQGANRQPGEPSLPARFADMRAHMSRAFNRVERYHYRFESIAPKSLADSPADFIAPPFDFDRYSDLLDAPVFGQREYIVGKPSRYWLDIERESADVDALGSWLAALKVDPVKAADFISRYRQLRHELRYHAWVTLHANPDGIPQYAFPFHRYTPLLAELPEEFALYTIGAWHYRSGYYEEAIRQFTNVLNLPAEHRHYRSVWAAYMLGLSWTHLDTARALPYFEMARNLATAGFSDSTGLAEASAEMQALAERYPDRYGFAMHHYLEELRAPEFDGKHQLYDALGRVCWKVLRADTIPESIVQSPEFMEVLSRWCLMAPREDTSRFLAAIRTRKLDTPPAGIGRFAYAAYQSGKMEQAAEWLDIARADEPYALWVSAKLAQRSGDLNSATALLEKLDTQLADTGESAPTRKDSFTATTHRLVLGELGTMKLNRDDYDGALDAFLRAGEFADAAYVADQLMTSGELEEFLKDRPSSAYGKPEDPHEREFSPPESQFRYLLARKLAREGAFTRALPYYPDASPLAESENGSAAPLAERLERYANALEVGHDRKRSNKERAMALMEAAGIARRWGLELMGTEAAPDWYLLGGSLKPWGVSRPEAGVATRNEAARAEKNAPVPNRRFHYRWKASALLWEAAKLLPNNDERTAKALWYGGTWIANQDPDGADKFYKALVRRCRKLPIGREADDLRWFPPKPEDWTALAGGE